MRTVVTANGIFRPEAPLSPAVRAGDLLFLSGITPFEADGTLAVGDFDRQMRRTMESVGAVLTAAGASFSSVVKCTVLLARRADWPAMNRTYAEYWPERDFPARTAFEEKLPHPEFLVEVECVAYVPRSEPSSGVKA
jgi:enamine deaminase RidA (YjgF/YER057c/UK114 family)